MNLKFANSYLKVTMAEIQEPLIFNDQETGGENESPDVIWRPIYNDDKVTNYSVSNKGQVRVSNTLQLRALSTTNGYVTCSLTYNGKKSTKQIHRLVADAFLPNDAGKKYVNHINSDKLDNRVENLEWVTSFKKSEQGVKPREEQKEPEINLDEFKPIEDYPKYSISKYGQIYSSFQKRCLTPRLLGSYMSVVLGGKNHECVHRLVAIHFIDKPENYEDNWVVIHKDGDKLNNGADNLEWMSPSDSALRMYENGSRKNVRAIVKKDLAGNIINEYLNAGQASRDLDLGRDVNSQILRACKNPEKSVVFGYKWEFKEI